MRKEVQTIGGKEKEGLKLEAGSTDRGKYQVINKMS